MKRFLIIYDSKVLESIAPTEKLFSNLVIKYSNNDFMIEKIPLTNISKISTYPQEDVEKVFVYANVTNAKSLSTVFSNTVYNVVFFNMDNIDEIS